MGFLRYVIGGVLQEYELGEKTVIGRSPECDLRLDDPTVSRKHCLISRGAHGFHIKDLRSTAGTLLNSELVRKAIIHEGDLITVGPFTLEFSEARKPSPAEGEEAPSAEALGSSPEGDLQVKKAISSPESVKISSVAPLKRKQTTSKRIKDLVEITSLLTHLATPEEHCSRVLPKILDCLGGDRARVLLREDETGEMKVLFAFGRTKATQRGASTFPRRLQELVVRKKQAVLVQDVLRDARLQGSDSTVQQRIRSAIAAPLVENQNCIGLLEADITTARQCYDENDLNSLCIVAQSLSSSLIAGMRYSSLQTENVALKTQHECRFLVGNSPEFRTFLEKAKQVAQSEATILLLGETGTGKSLLAKAIHEWSPRSRRPFIEINCPNVPDTLAESELFGYERGAFTGAFQSKKGMVEIAQGGTLLFEEIGDLSESMQGKLLQFLDSRVFQRLGSTTSRNADVRIIASTNRNLPAEAEAGRFRLDLLHRINVVSLDLPALRDRKEDIPTLATHFVRIFAEREKKPSMQLSGQAMEILLEHEWPGNIRELENVIERAVILCNEASIGPEHLPIARERVVSVTEHSSSYHDAVDAKRKRTIENALAQCNGVQREAAKLLGLNETHLSRLIKKFGIKK